MLQRSFIFLKINNNVCKLNQIRKITKITNHDCLKNEQKKPTLDPNSINWVLTLKYKESLGLTFDEIADLHGHSGGSLAWTLKQLKIIDEKGFDYWFYETDGPLGYKITLKKFFEN